MDLAHDFSFVIMNAYDQISSIQMTSGGLPLIMENKHLSEMDNQPMKILNEDGQDCSKEYKVVECLFEVDDDKVLPVGAYELMKYSAINEISGLNCDCSSISKQFLNADIVCKQTDNSDYTALDTRALASDCTCGNTMNNLSTQPDALLMTFNLADSSCKDCSPVEKTRRMEIRVEDFRLANAKRDAADVKLKHNLGLFEGVSDQNYAAAPISTQLQLNSAHTEADNSNVLEPVPLVGKVSNRCEQGPKADVQNESAKILLSECKDFGNCIQEKILSQNFQTRNASNLISPESGKLLRSGLRLKKNGLTRTNLRVALTRSLKRSLDQQNSQRESLDSEAVKVKHVKRCDNQSSADLQSDVSLKDSNDICMLQNKKLDPMQEPHDNQPIHLSALKPVDQNITTANESEKISVSLKASNICVKDTVNSSAIGNRPRNDYDHLTDLRTNAEIRCKGLMDWNEESDSSCDILLLPELPADELDSKPVCNTRIENGLFKSENGICSGVSKSSEDANDVLQNHQQLRLERVRQLLTECVKTAEQKLGSKALRNAAVCTDESQPLDDSKSNLFHVRIGPVSENENEKTLALEKEVIERNKMIDFDEAKLKARMIHLQELEMLIQEQQTKVNSERKKLSEQKIRLRKERKKLIGLKFRLKTIKRMVGLQFTCKKNLKTRRWFQKEGGVKALGSAASTVDFSIQENFDDGKKISASASASRSLSSLNDSGNLEHNAATENLSNLEIISSFLHPFAAKSLTEFHDGIPKDELNAADQAISSNLEISDSSSIPFDENFIHNSCESVSAASCTAGVDGSFPIISDRVETNGNPLSASSCLVLESLPFSSTSTASTVTSPLPSKGVVLSCRSPSKPTTCRLSPVSCNQFLPLKDAAGKLLAGSICMMPSISLVPVTSPYVASHYEQTCVDDLQKSPLQLSQKTASRENRSKTRKS